MKFLSSIPKNLVELNAVEIVSARGKIQFALLPICVNDVPEEQHDAQMMKYLEAFGDVYPGPQQKDTANTLKLIERWNAANENGRKLILQEVKERLDEYLGSKPN